MPRLGALLAGTAAVLIAMPADAARFVPATPEDGNLTVGGAPIADDLYLAGQNVDISAQVQGDLHAAGRDVTVRGTVDGDAVLAGGHVQVLGTVGDDLRVAGGTVDVHAPVHGDVLAGGGEVRIGREAIVGGDLIAGGGRVLVAGPVAGKVRLAGQDVTLDAAVHGDVEVRAARFVLGPAARVDGTVRLRGPQPAVVAGQARVGQMQYQYDALGQATTPGQRLLAALLQIVAGTLAGLVLVRVAGPAVQDTLQEIWRAPWRDLGIGLATVLLVPWVVVLLLLTVVGYALAALVGMTWALGLLVALIVETVLVGAVARRLFRRDRGLQLEKGLPVDGWSALLGAVLLVAVGQIPWVGPLVIALLFLPSVGALARLLKLRRRPPPTRPVETEPSAAGLGLHPAV